MCGHAVDPRGRLDTGPWGRCRECERENGKQHASDKPDGCMQGRSVRRHEDFEKGVRWMPWLLTAMKDVTGCDKPRGDAE